MMLRSIYVVDDDDAARKSLFMLFAARSEYIVKSFAAGEAFISECHELDPGVLILDQNMPGARGLQVLEQLSDHSNKFAVIMLTGLGSIDLAVQAMRAGAFGFLEKPLRPPMLFAEVATAFSRLERDADESVRQSNARAKIKNLAPREKDVLRRLIDGKQNKVIAWELGLSPRTVEIYRANLMQRLDVTCLAEAIKMAFAAGFVPLMDANCSPPPSRACC